MLLFFRHENCAKHFHRYTSGWRLSPMSTYYAHDIVGCFDKILAFWTFHMDFVQNSKILKSKFVYFCFSGMRTARNIFIATLAVGDSALCLLTMPMTLLGVLTKYWPFGPSTWILCKIVRTSPAITVFFSSYTMAIIAIDRHRFIVHSTKRQVCTSCHS